MVNESAVKESGSIMKMFEDQTIKLAKDGMNLDEIARSMPQYETKRSAIYRKKWTNYPKIPKELHELIFENEIYKNTLATGERFLLVDCCENGQRIVIFCSNEQLKQNA